MLQLLPNEMVILLNTRRALTHDKGQTINSLSFGHWLKRLSHNYYSAASGSFQFQQLRSISCQSASALLPPRPAFAFLFTTKVH
jgi:hypothetical protein